MSKEKVNDFSVSYKDGPRFTLTDKLKGSVDFWVFKNRIENQDEDTYAIVVNVVLGNLGNHDFFPTIIMNGKGDIQKITETKVNFTLTSIYHNIIVDEQVMKIIDFGFINNYKLKEKMLKAIISLIAESSDEEKKPLNRFLCSINDNASYDITIFAKNFSEALAKLTVLAKNIPEAKGISVNLL